MTRHQQYMILRKHIFLYVDTVNLPTSFDRVLGPEYLQNPDTASDWVQSDIDDLQATLDST